MRATPAQIKLFTDKAKQYHGWDKGFIELIENSNYEGISSHNMRNLINDMFNSYRDVEKKHFIANRLRNINKKGGE